MCLNKLDLWFIRQMGVNSSSKLRSNPGDILVILADQTCYDSRLCHEKSVCICPLQTRILFTTRTLSHRRFVQFHQKGVLNSLNYPIYPMVLHGFQQGFLYVAWNLKGQGRRLAPHVPMQNKIQILTVYFHLSSENRIQGVNMTCFLSAICVQ